jgi:uncharacterized membrane protein YkvA (DUF1232 family)
MEGSVVVAVVAGLVLAWLLLLGLLWLLRPRGVPARELLRVIPDLLRLARSIVGDRSVPLDVRLAVVGALVWVISPIDPVPEIIPVVGQVDEVIIIVLALRYVRHRLGRDELRARWPGSDDGFAMLTTLMG